MNDLMKKIELSRLKIFLQEPFLGYVLQRIEIELVDDIETAATNGKKIMFGIKFLKDLTLKQTIFVLLHELLHIVLEHPKRGRKFEDQYRFNIACDIVVNETLKSFGFSNEGVPLIDGSKYYMSGLGYTVEDIYHLLPDDIKGKTLDYHIAWDLEDIDDGKIDEIIESAISTGYESSIDGLIDRSINNVEYGYESNKWKELLNRYVTKDIFDYSFSKIDNRYGNVLLPSFVEDEECLKNIWFVVDVSFSMRNSHLALMFGEIERIIRHYKSVQCDISFFSTVTTEPIKFKDKKDLFDTFHKIRSSGGTDFKQIFTDMKDFYFSKLPSLVVVMTDGLAEYPALSEMFYVPVVWCLTNDRNLPETDNYIVVNN
jgi:predicted metal-dependent peptidase